MSTEVDRARRRWFAENILPLEPALRRFARRIAPSDVDPEDIVHDTLVRIMGTTDWERINSPESFAKTILRNCVYDMLRRRRLVHFDLLGNLESLELTADEPDPEQTLLGKDELRRLAEIVATLPIHCRRVFTLRQVYGFSNGAIAERLGVTVSTVEKHLAKALVLCSEALERRADGRDGKGGHGDRARTATGTAEGDGGGVGRPPYGLRLPGE